MTAGPGPLPGFRSDWNAVHTTDGWVLVEPVPDHVVSSAPAGPLTDLSAGLPPVLPPRLVVLTAANPGGVLLSDAENAERYRRLLERVRGIGPFPRQAPATYPTIGGHTRYDSPSDWAHQEDGIALDISRDEAALLSAEFGQMAYYSFEGATRLLIGAGDEGVLAMQRYRTHCG